MASAYFTEPIYIHNSRWEPEILKIFNFLFWPKKSPPRHIFGRFFVGFLPNRLGNLFPGPKTPKIVNFSIFFRNFWPGNFLKNRQGDPLISVMGYFCDGFFSFLKKTSLGAKAPSPELWHRRGWQTTSPLVDLVAWHRSRQPFPRKRAETSGLLTRAP